MTFHDQDPYQNTIKNVDTATSQSPNTSSPELGYLSLSSDRPAGGYGVILGLLLLGFPRSYLSSLSLDLGSVFPLSCVGVYFPHAYRLNSGLKDLGTVYIGKTTFLHGGAFEERGMRRYFSGGHYHISDKRLPTGGTPVVPEVLVD